ncbi:transposase [Spirochaeta cellobiosiphila]|uniref:transposase n=1 Tax=Spirochaeta cellobiosiphila TaxID=504483 RepID=UPI00069DCE36|nr:transposase [Spirochaeta cellobiosiphila]
MAKYNDYSYQQTLMSPVSFKKQILPGTFEYTLSHLIDEQIDLSIFANRYENDTTDAPQFFAKQKTVRTPHIRHNTYDTAILLKIILYTKGINSSRKIAQLCNENIVSIYE